MIFSYQKKGQAMILWQIAQLPQEVSGWVLIMMNEKTEPYDVVDYLHTEQDIQGYLDAVLESGASFKAISKAFMDA